MRDRLSEILFSNRYVPTLQCRFDPYILATIPDTSLPTLLPLVHPLSPITNCRTPTFETSTPPTCYATPLLHFWVLSSGLLGAICNLKALQSPFILLSTECVTRDQDPPSLWGALSCTPSLLRSFGSLHLRQRSPPGFVSEVRMPKLYPEVKGVSMYQKWADGYHVAFQ